MQKKTSAQELGQKIKAIRAESGLTQEEFAARVGVSQRTVSSMERGERGAGWEVLVAIRHEFGVSADYLLGATAGAIAGGPVPYGGKEMTIEAMAGRLQGLEKAIGLFLSSGGSRKGRELAVQLFGKQYRHTQIPFFEIGGDAVLPFKGDLPPSEAEQYVARPTSVFDPDAFACKMMDDSMIPEFRQGDTLVFAPILEIVHGDYACVRIGENETLFRQVFIEEDIVRLVPISRKYPEMRLARDQVMGMFRLVARITEL